MDLNSLINNIFNDQIRLQLKTEKLSKHRGTTTFISMLDRYKKAIDWMQEKGIKIHPSSRVMKYKSIFSESAEKISNGDSPLQILNDKYTKATIHDAYKFINCIENIQTSDAFDTKVIEAFTKAVNGPLCYTEEKGDNAKARNYLFELEASIQFYNKTSRFTFGENEQGDINPLLTIEKNDIKINYRLMVECKRIQSRKSIEKNIKIAVTQANLRISRSPNDLSYTYICLDVTKLVNPENEISICEDGIKYVIASEKYSQDLQELTMALSHIITESYKNNPNLLVISLHSFCLMMQKDFEVPTGVPTKIMTFRENLNPEQKMIIHEIMNASSNGDLNI